MTSEASANPMISAHEALQRLLAGNKRFLAGEARFPIVCKETLADLAKGQQPYATILCCADSRVPPEVIFDATLGELFVVRVAGNVVSPEVMGSLQYAGAHLNTPLFLVLGHEGCGAVQAALDSKLHHVEHQSRIQILVNNIVPGLAGLDAEAPPDQQLHDAVAANVRWSMRQLRESAEGSRALSHAKATLAGAVYEIASGSIRLLD
jgi:carbonic anhydrase